MNTEKNYLLTHTLGHHLSAFRRADLKIPSESFIVKVEQKIEALIRELFANSPDKVQVKSFQFPDLCDGIIASTKVLHGQFPEAVVVSTTPLITYDAQSGVCLALNRLVDLEGNALSIGPRPHHPPVSRQFDAVAGMIKSRQAIVIDDGAFTGATLELIITELRKRKIEVVGIALGILFPEAEERLKRLGCEAIHTVFCENIVDWMPVHDFLPFVPNCGKVIGQKIGNFYCPIHLFNGSTMSIPYIGPYGDPKKWAGLGVSDMDLNKFSQFCLSQAMDIFTEMNQLNGKKIQIGELLHTNPEVSMPVFCGRNLISDVHSLSESVVDVLKDDYIFLT